MKTIVIILLIIASLPSLAGAQNVIVLNRGERLLSVDGRPVQEINAPAAVAPANIVRQQPAGPVRGMFGAARNIVGNLVQTGQPFSHTPGETAMEKANYERRLNGQGPLQIDPALHALALQKATIAAQRGIKDHIGGSLGGAKSEGVGHTNGRFLSCCLDMPATYGGAAMVQGRDGWYCCLLVR